MLWYGMHGLTLKKIKEDILKKKFTKKSIMEKYDITDEQFELICKWKLRLSYKSIDERLSSIESRLEKIENATSVTIGTKIKSSEYGDGEVVSLNSFDLMLVYFYKLEKNVMCNRKTMVTVHDKTSRKLFVA